MQQLNQRFSGAKDSVGAYANAGLFNGGKKLAQSPAPRQDTNPWELMGGRKMLFH